MNYNLYIFFFAVIASIFNTIPSVEAAVSTSATGHTHASLHPDSANSASTSSATKSKYKYPLIKIDPTNMVFLRGVVNGKSASKIVNELISLKSKEIYLYIDSPGGSVLDGLQIIQTMESLQQAGVKIYTIANNAASMAYVIHQHGTERYVKPWSVLMQHQMSLGLYGQYYNLKAYTNLIDKLHEKMLEKQALAAGVSVEDFNELTRHDMWLLGEESVERGFADKVVNVVCDFQPSVTSEIMYTWWGDVTLVFSTCPLSNKPLEIKFPNNLTPEQTLQITNQYNTHYGYNLLSNFTHRA